MAETKIEWADFTFNPWIGCTKVSEGCANCYAERDFDKRRGYAKWGPSGTRVKTSEANWNKPRAWNRKAEKEGVRFRVFCASLSDVFEDWQHATRNHNGNLIFKKRNVIGEYVSKQNEFPSPPLSHVSLNDLRRDLFDLIDETPYLDWLLVTKRPENIQRMWPCMNDTDGDGDCHLCCCGKFHRRKNVWLLTSVENQEQADKRIPELLKCRGICPVLGLSCEPLLGPIDLNSVPRPDNAYFSQRGETGVLPDMYELDDYVYEVKRGINWVIAGGESGPNARPMHPDWLRSICSQCDVAEVPFFFKQWGEWWPLHGTGRFRGDEEEEITPYAWLTTEGEIKTCGHSPDALMVKIGKKSSGRELDSVEHNEFPEVQL